MMLSILRKFLNRPVPVETPSDAFHEQMRQKTAFSPLPKYMPSKTMEVVINEMVAKIHELNKTWWTDLETGAHKDRNTGEVLMLIVSELSEAMEGARKGLMDDHIPEEKMFDVELADVFIRLLDLAGGKDVNLGKMVTLKLEYNKHRADHKVEQRKADGGKKF